MRRGLSNMGFSTRLALVVALGFVSLELVMLTVSLSQSGSREGEWRLPAGARLAAVAEVVETAPQAERARLLQAFSTRDTRFSVAGSDRLKDYVDVTDIRRSGRRPRASGLGLRRDVRILERADRSTPTLWDRLTGEGATRRTVAVKLRTGSYLFVESVRRDRRRATVFAVLLWNAVFGSVIVSLVWVFTRRLAFPLETIAARAEGFANDPSAPAMDDQDGPPEARRMAAAFNKLRADVRLLMSDRMQMLAAIVHDLKTYLTRLNMRTSLIDDPEHRDAADRDIGLMAALIEDVLLAARGETRPPELKRLDLVALTEEILAARRMIGREIPFTCETRPAWVHADAAGVRRALDNLIENALIYGGTCELSCVRNGWSWIVEVIDHGPGLPSGFAEVALNPFTRGEPSRNRETGGAGLGLFIASTLSRQSGGKLVLSETPGGGLTATLSFSAAPKPHGG